MRNVITPEILWKDLIDSMDEIGVMLNPKDLSDTYTVYFDGMRVWILGNQSQGLILLSSSDVPPGVLDDFCQCQALLKHLKWYRSAYFD